MQTAKLTGEWRQPVNTAAHQKGGIHDDATATKLGFSGGTVAGAIHMEQFLPLTLEVFGNTWWERGVLSIFFLKATMHRDPVRCFMSELDDDGQAAVWMENEAGEQILSGTASLGGCAKATALRERLETLRPATDLRILGKFAVGQTATIPSRVGMDFLDRQLSVITENHAAFTSGEPFDQRALPCTQVVRSFDPAEAELARAAIQPFVGLYGGIEIEYLTGPVLVETDYDATCEVVGLSESPKTEILWRESYLERDGVRVARMLKMDRIMKNSSPLWDE